MGSTDIDAPGHDTHFALKKPLEQFKHYITTLWPHIVIKIKDKGV